MTAAQVRRSQPATPALQAEAPLSQLGPEGIRFDFNAGCRVSLPKGQWSVELTDLDTGNVLFRTEMGEGRVFSAKRYYVRFRIRVSAGSRMVLEHEFDARDREVLISFPVRSLGDTIGWFSYAARFQEKHGCRLTCEVSEPLIALFAGAYPQIKFVNWEEGATGKFYATYKPILYFNDTQRDHQPSDYQQVGLHRNAAYILGVDPADSPPRLALSGTKRPVEEPYVCIATQSTAQCKYWNNPHGWREIVSFLKASGYRVFCIDQKPVHGEGLVWNHIPNGVEDLTGDRPLLERAAWLRHAQFFVGLSSGLSWLAWASGTPVVLISGFTHPINEFETPYRVINYHACNSCFNDVRLPYGRSNYMACPRHAGTPRQFECTRLITADHVKAVIRQIPGFPQG